MKTSFRIFLLVLLCNMSVFAQKREQKEQQAKKDLIFLNKGYLFFQFFDREVTKNAIRIKLGDKAVAQYEAEQKENEDKLMNAFKNYYHFSKVAFFYSHDKPNILAKEFSKVKFYNTSRQLIPTDSINFSHFYIAEISRIELDSTSYTDENGITTKSPASSFSALIVRDSNFVQMKAPFPYYIRTMEGMPIFGKKSNRLIKAFQNKLERKY